MTWPAQVSQSDSISLCYHISITASWDTCCAEQLDVGSPQSKEEWDAIVVANAAGHSDVPPVSAEDEEQAEEPLRQAAAM